MHSLTWNSTSPAAVRFRSELFRLREQADARIFWLLIAQWAVNLVTSVAMATFWKTASLTTLSSAIVWVGVLSMVPLAMVLRSPGSSLARWTVVVSQGVMSTLLWYVSGGRPDTMLHLFAWLVVLALYRDIPALVAMMALSLAGHTLVFLGSTLPAFSSADAAHWTTHLIWLACLCGEAAFLVTLILLDRQTLASQVERDQTIETLKQEHQQQLEEVTRQLEAERDLAKGELASLTERHSKVESSRSETSRELLALRRDIANHGTSILKLASRQADSTLSKEWRAQWQALRQQAQHLMRLVDLPSLEPERSERKTKPSPMKLSRSEHVPMESQLRAMLMMRNPLQQTKALTALESLGYKVDVVVNGPRTYYSVMLNEYSVIVVDIDLPDDEGFDTLEALQLLPSDKMIQKTLFAVTSEMTQERVMRCTELGVDGMFLKPLQAEALRQSLVQKRPVVSPARDSTRSSRSGSESVLLRST